MEAVFTKSPLSVDEEGKKADKPDDYLEEYLSKDFRPYQLGWRDRYGSFDYSHSVGFFPDEHKEKPAAQDWDAIQKSKFEPEGEKPEINDPDVKMMARCSKYGIYALHNDVGYWWKKGEDGDLGEFTGKFEDDREWEIKRFKYWRKHFNEQEPKDRDQRRYEVRTRYGHKFEMRDVGWAQKGPVESKSRPEEFDEERTLSKEAERDETWIKLRSKNGHLFQMYDKGVNYKEDEFIKRLLKKEIGGTPDEEDGYWKEKDDCRWMRLMTRWGLKFVLDDRGCHYTEAHAHIKPRGNGFLVKGRRAVCEDDDGVGLGFGIEFCEKKQLNKLSAYTPKSKLLELNDKKDYIMLCSDTPKPISEEWAGLKRHEFTLSMAMEFDPEIHTHHLKLDLANEYIRLKSRAGRGVGSRGETGCDDPSSPNQALGQGLEARDGELFGGCGETWTELNDADDRGLWMSHNEQLLVLRARRADFENRPPREMHVAFSDKDEVIVIRNGQQKGRIQIYCNKDVEIVGGKNIKMEAKETVSIKAGKKLCIEAGGSHLSLQRNQLGTDAVFNAPRSRAFHEGCLEGPGAGPKSPISCSPLSVSEYNIPRDHPSDRGKVCNGPFDRQPETVLEQPDDADAGPSGR